MSGVLLYTSVNIGVEQNRASPFCRDKQQPLRYLAPRDIFGAHGCACLAALDQFRLTDGLS